MSGRGEAVATRSCDWREKSEAVTGENELLHKGLKQ